MPKLFRTLNSKLLSSFVLLVITGALLITCTFTFALAWFSSNRSTSANQLKINVADRRITLSDTIEVTRTLAQSITTQIFRCEGEDNYYYLYENDAFVTDEQGNRIPFCIPNLLPGELVDVSFGYRCTDALIGSAISATLTDIFSDTFAEIDHPEIQHSVLGVYKLSVKEGDDYSEGKWIVDYVSGTADPIPEELTLFSDVTWNKISDVEEENFVWTSFRFKFDLEQYYDLKTTTNLLSEKSFWIGELRIEVTGNE